MTERSLLGAKPVNRIGFGAMQLAGPGVFGPPADPEGARTVLRRAIELGVEHIDTSQFYGPDLVNQLIREALHPYPENLDAFAGGHGPLTSNIAEAGGFIRSDPALPAPDLQLLAAPAMFMEEPVLEHGFGLAACVLDPASRGFLAPLSPDPTVKPYIVHNYLSDQGDMDRMLDGMRQMLEIAERSPLAPYTTRPYYVPASDSEEDLRAHIRQHATTVFHPVGTCRMGSDSDAVVDTELRVRGVEALRVVDASVMPTVTRGNTNAPTIAIAERAAELITGRAGVREQTRAHA